MHSFRDNWSSILSQKVKWAEINMEPVTHMPLRKCTPPSLSPGLWEKLLPWLMCKLDTIMLWQGSHAFYQESNGRARIASSTWCFALSFFLSFELYWTQKLSGNTTEQYKCLSQSSEAYWTHLPSMAWHLGLTILRKCLFFFIVAD